MSIFAEDLGRVVGYSREEASIVKEAAFLRGYVAAT
jgi:hypothetical protein